VKELNEKSPMNTNKSFEKRTVLAIRKELGRTCYAEGGKIYVPGFGFGRYKNWLDALDFLAKYGEEGGAMQRLLQEANTIK
jgi:hypothetical protein